MTPPRRNCGPILSAMGSEPGSRQGHGSRACYTAGCREPECRAANARYMRDWRAASPGYAFNNGLAYRRPEARIRRRAPNGARSTT